MFLEDGTLVQLNADGTESATIRPQQHQRSLTIGSSYQADVVLNEPMFVGKTASGTSSSIYCEITGDVGGRVSQPTPAPQPSHPTLGMSTPFISPHTLVDGVSICIDKYFEHRRSPVVGERRANPEKTTAATWQLHRNRRA